MTKHKRPQWLPVVAAIIRREDKVLLGQRPDHKLMPGLWEFPGGKIEVGESPEEALKRELKEELGIDAEIGPLRVTCTHHYGEVGVVLIFFEVNFWKGEPKALFHTALRWVTADELRHTPLPDANRLVLDRIIDFLGG